MTTGMHHITFLQDLAIVMIVAACVTVIFRQLKQPIVLGYVLAGVIIGPHTPPFSLITEKEAIETLSELGVIFLMFGLGLEFSLRKLRKVGVVAFIAAAFEILLMIWVGYQIGILFGWSQLDSIFLGAILSISSTTIIIKTLEELGLTRAHCARMIFGILIVEDILAIVMIALLSGVATTGSLAVGDVARTILTLGSFLGILLVAGLILVPRLLHFVASFKNKEVLLITVLGLCLGVSLLAAKLDYSVALGAFLIGAIIAESRQLTKIEALMLPIRDLFSAVFFVSIGLLIDPVLLGKYAGPIVIITVAVIVGKVVTCGLGTFVAGNDLRTSLRVGMGLAQIGEFSFIIAALGLSLQVTSDFIYPIAVAVSALTTLATPYLIRSSDRLVAGFDRIAPRPVVNFLEAYTLWIGRIVIRGKASSVSRLVRASIWQIVINLLLVAGVFIAVIAVRRHVAGLWPNIPGGDDSLKAILWAVAVLLSLPMLIATIRKMQALGMIVAEMSVSRASAGDNTAALRSVVSATVFGVGVAALLLFILLLSSAILPSWNALLVAGLALVGAAFLLRRSFIKLYARAQVALRETLDQPAISSAEEKTRHLTALLETAEIDRIQLAPDSPAVGKTIRGLSLRSSTGASIVAIERADQTIVNPGPEEELLSADRLLLLGDQKQLASAKSLLIGDAEANAEKETVRT